MSILFDMKFRDIGHDGSCVHLEYDSDPSQLPESKICVGSILWLNIRQIKSALETGGMTCDQMRYALNAMRCLN
jgi:hypothetical protein